MRRALVLVLWLAAAAPAAALPEDPPVAVLTPAEGAVLPTDPAGIPVSYACPLYHSTDYGDGTGIINGEDAYTVLMSDSPQLDADGRLANADARVVGASRPADPNVCFAALGSTQFAPFPQSTPGRWYWQVSRICSFCSPQFEVSAVRSFTLRPATKPKLEVPARAYAGYPFIAALTGASFGANTDVTIERRSGSAYKKVGAGSIASGAAAATVVLPKGRQTLRARIEIPGQTVVSAAATVRVRQVKGAKVTRVRAGTWKGGGAGATSFRVAGRRLKGFSSRVTLLCPTPGMVNPFSIQVAVAAVKSTRLAPDGTFVGASTRSGSVRIRGRLKGRKLSGGVVEMSLGPCTGTAELKASAA